MARSCPVLLRISLLIAATAGLASCSASEDRAELASAARSLSLAKIFVFADEAFQEDAGSTSHPAPRLWHQYLTALPIARACDLAQERLARLQIAVERTDQKGSCGLAFSLVPRSRNLVGGGLQYQGCIVVQNGPAGAEREVHLTLNTASAAMSCAAPGFARDDDEAAPSQEPVTPSG